MIPDSFKQDLLNRVDIVDVVSRYVQLKKGGANFQGLCPFHTEKSPSFTVSPAKQFYHCFGCGAHGNAIGFLMAYASMGYVDAVKDLAASAGMTVPEMQRSPQDIQRRERETDLYAVMEKAMEIYRAQLKESYVVVRNGELFLIGAHISPLLSASTHGSADPTRSRKLLMRSEEIARLAGKVERAGYTLVPVDLHFTHGRVKLGVGLAKGKKQYDKRDDEKKKNWQREQQRLMKSSRRN